MSTYQERYDRIMAAVHLEDTDRVPFMSSGSAVNAAIEGVPLAEYVADMELNCTVNLEATMRIGVPDGCQVTTFQPAILPSLWLGNVLLPGVDLPDNELWQMAEAEIVTQDDYDEILEGGFGPWYEKVLVERLNDPMPKCAGFLEYFGTGVKRFADAGIPCFYGTGLYAPIEMYCGGRMLMNFFMDDLMDIPEKLQQVFRVTQDYNLAQWDAQFSDPATRPHAVWVGGWRGTPDLLNPQMFEEFSWRYMLEIVDMLLQNDVVPLLHLDSNWNNGFKFLRQLPAGKCIAAFDGQSDIFVAKKAIGDRVCVMGDVPAQLLAFGSAEDVDSYCKRLIDECGPTGFILSSGCDAPFNAKLENMQAMAQSVHKYTR